MGNWGLSESGFTGFWDEQDADSVRGIFDLVDADSDGSSRMACRGALEDAALRSAFNPIADYRGNSNCGCDSGDSHREPVRVYPSSDRMLKFL